MNKTKYAFTSNALAECIKEDYGIEISDRSAGAALDFTAHHGRHFREVRTAAKFLVAFRRRNGKWPRLSNDERIEAAKKPGSGRPSFGGARLHDIKNAAAAIDDMWWEDRPITLTPSLSSAIDVLRKAGIKSITLA